MIDMLEMGDGDTLAVPAATAGKARAIIAGEHGVDFTEVQVRLAYLRPCDCEGCQENGPAATHYYDEFWMYCEKGDDGAVRFWVEV